MNIYVLTYIEFEILALNIEESISFCQNVGLLAQTKNC